MASELIPEIQFAQKVASNDKTLRDRAVRKLKQWLSKKSESNYSFEENDLLKLWKGLYFCVWMSDKPLVQEELVEKLSSLIFCFGDINCALMFMKCFFKTVSREWFSIDKWRIDKFLMLVRRMFRHFLYYLKSNSWESEVIVKFSEMLSDNVLTTSEDFNTPTSLKYHIIDMFCEELAKVGKEKLSSEVIVELLSPFIKLYVKEKDKTVINFLEDRIFKHLMRQSDVGIKYEIENPVKRITTSTVVCQAYEVIGEKVCEPVSDDEEDNGPLDPRAGLVHVELPQLIIDYNSLAENMLNIGKVPGISPKGRNRAYTMVKNFQNLAHGMYPLAMKFPEEGNELTELDIEAAAEDLVEFDRECNSDSGKAYKKRKLKEPGDKKNPSVAKKIKSDIKSKTKTARAGRKLRKKHKLR